LGAIDQHLLAHQISDQIGHAGVDPVATEVGRCASVTDSQHIRACVDQGLSDRDRSAFGRIH
jgi:hypothetical protein